MPPAAATSWIPRFSTSHGPLTVSTMLRRSWPTCALPVSVCPQTRRPARRCPARRCPARRWRAGYVRQHPAEIGPRTFAHATTVADPYAPLPKDLVGRRSDTGVLDRVWTSDIAYPRTGQCRQYLCAVRDGCSRRVIGWTINEHMRADLVESALAMAVAMRGELAKTGMVHADRGCRYTSAQLARFARRH